MPLTLLVKNYNLLAYTVTLELTESPFGPGGPAGPGGP